MGSLSFSSKKNLVMEYVMSHFILTSGQVLLVLYEEN